MCTMSDQEDDISIDTEDESLDDSVLAEEAQGDTIKKLREKLKAAEGKAREYLDGWQRAQADFANMRKRDEEEKRNFAKFANARFVEELIPVVDALDLAVTHGDPAKDGASNGVEQTLNLFLKVLKQNGVEVINPIGETFNPEYHEAVAMVEVETNEDDHKILEVMQKGYILQGKIIRAAKVKIGNK
jgi:molecular chaperone GrpE